MTKSVKVLVGFDAYSIGDFAALERDMELAGLTHVDLHSGPRLPQLRHALEGAYGQEDHLQYVFGDTRMTARMYAGDPDVLEFSVTTN